MEVNGIRRSVMSVTKTAGKELVKLNGFVNNVRVYFGDNVYFDDWLTANYQCTQESMRNSLHKDGADECVVGNKLFNYFNTFAEWCETRKLTPNL
jgi:hypothetical protein